MNAPISLRVDLEERLRLNWSWPSPESGFSRWIFTSAEQEKSWFSSWTHESMVRELQSQSHWNHSPLLAACGFAATECELPVEITEKWVEGFERLQQRDPFPHDRQAFPFRPLELLGLSLAVTRFATESGKEWFRKVVERTQVAATPFDFWSWSLTWLALRISGAKQPSAGFSSFWSATDENCALLFWAHTFLTASDEIEVDIPEALLEQTKSHLQSALFSPLPTLQTTADIDKNALYLFALDALNQPQTMVPAPKTSMVSYQTDNLRGQVDFAIITVREDEFAAVLKRFAKGFFYQGQHRTYVVHRLPLENGQSYSVATVRCSEQGGAAGQQVASDVIADLAPHWIVLAGIAGGVPASEFTLGDVVTAMRLQDFSVQARCEGGTTQYATGGGPMHRQVQDYLALLPAMSKSLGDWNQPDTLGVPQPPVSLAESNFYGDADWRESVQQSLQRHFGDGSRLHLPRVTAGAIAASDALMKDTELLNQWKQSARQLLAVEMELAGVYTAARTKEREYPVAAVRGISDIVGFKRHPDWTEYACQTAASFTHALIASRPFDPVTKTSSSLSD